MLRGHGAAEGPVMEERRVERWMTHDVLTLRPDERLSDALELMERERIRHVPIVDSSGRLAGIVSDRDVKRVLLDKKQGLTLDRPLSSVMTKRVQRLEPGATLREAAEIMCREKISALPVCDGDEILGIVTSEDVLWAYCELDEGESEEREDDEIDRTAPPDREAA
jgi:acetoin utilization protein AcuB